MYDLLGNEDILREEMDNSICPLQVPSTQQCMSLHSQKNDQPGILTQVIQNSRAPALTTMSPNYLLFKFVFLLNILG